MALQASLFQLAHAHLARMPCLGVSKLYKCAGLSGAALRSPQQTLRTRNRRRQTNAIALAAAVL
jgi:hypothetical protein